MTADEVDAAIAKLRGWSYDDDEGLWYLDERGKGWSGEDLWWEATDQIGRVARWGAGGRGVAKGVIHAGKGPCESIARAWLAWKEREAVE